MKLKKVLSLVLAIGCLATSSAGLTSKAAKGNTSNNQKPSVIGVRRAFTRRHANMEILVQAALEALEALKKEDASKAAFGGDKNLQYTFWSIEKRRTEKYCNEKSTKNKNDIELREEIHKHMEKTKNILLKKEIWERFLKEKQLPRNIATFKNYCNSIIKYSYEDTCMKNFFPIELIYDYTRGDFINLCYELCKEKSQELQCG